MRVHSFFFCCCLLICSAMAVSCSNKNGQTPQGEAQTYQTMTITLADETITDNYTASIKGKQDIDIYPQISGTIGKICVKEGQRVAKGQRLFVIEQETYYASLNQAVAGVKSAEASLTSAQLTYGSKEQLFKDSVISNYELQTARNALAKAQATLAEAKAQEASARTNYNYTVITSPANGVVGNLPYFQGDLVSSAITQPLTTVSDNSEIYAYFSITEKQLLALNREYGSTESAMQKLPAVTLQLSDGTTYGHAGKIESISGVVDRSTGATTLRAKFPNPEGLLHSGFTGNVQLPTTYKDCIVVPQSATTEVQDKIFVYKVVDGKAKSTQVSVRAMNGGTQYVVTDGLQEGDVIVSVGAGLLKEGTPISTKQSASAAQRTKQGKAVQAKATPDGKQAKASQNDKEAK